MANRNADVDNLARLEAEARVIMWQHSQIPHPSIYVAGNPRATRAKERARLHREFDEIIDRWDVSRLLIALEHLDAS